MVKYLGYTLGTLITLLMICFLLGIWKFNDSLFGEKTHLLTYSDESKPIVFEWANDSIGNYYETQVAMVIPVKMEGLNHELYMQFDTGSPYTFIYENDLISLKGIGLNLVEVMVENQRYVEQMEFELGGNKVNASMIKILEGYGNTFNASDTIGGIKIGTIGSDFMENRITTIDFQNKRIQTYLRRTDWMAALPDFRSFDFQGRRIMLPTMINGKELSLLYDSGCSAFGLITTWNRFEDYTDERTETIAYDANSWGNGIPIRHKSTNQKMLIGNANLSMERASYVNMYAWTQRYVTSFTRVGGWLGNRPFAECTLILDTQTEKFIIIKNSDLNGKQYHNQE